MKRTVTCETYAETIKELCLGGHIVDARIQIGYRNDAEGVIYNTKIEQVPDVAIRLLYRTEDQSDLILNEYLEKIADEGGAAYWRWAF